MFGLSPWKKLLLILVMIVSLVGVGCVTPTTYGGDAGATAAVDGQSGYQQTGSKGRAALFVAAAVLVVAVIWIDLILLPCTYEDPFPCTEEVIVLCD